MLSKVSNEQQKYYNKMQNCYRQHEILMLWKNVNHGI